ncbi:MAG: hypothetical protein ACSHXD_15435 [Marinosulfonomonas sp.]
MNLSDAYRDAYDAENMKPNVIHVEASRLAARPNVALRIDELLYENSLDQRMQAISRRGFVLDRLAKEALHAATASARIRALELLGKSVGLFDASQEVTSSRSIEELESELHKLIGFNS